jgi:MFS family permease
MVFTHSHTGLSGWSLAPALGGYGFGMGMIFVPLFDIIMGEVSDREVGSASAILESLQQLGASVGVAGLGTVFFGMIGAHAGMATFFAAAQRVTLITVVLIAAAFALGFLLPRHARRTGHGPAEAEAASDLATETEAAEGAEAQRVEPAELDALIEQESVTV